MSSPVRADPPYVPIRHTRWPVRRTPRWLLLALALLIVAAVLVALAHKPSTSQRVSDMRGFLSDMTNEIESCAGGVSESLAALHQLGPLPSTNASEVADTISIATYGASNCSPANSMPLDDLTQYQVVESLASFNLTAAVNGLINWAAPDAINVQNDVVALLSAPDAQARTTATARLQRAISTLDKQRAAVDSVIDRAIRSLAMHASPPSLPG
jgi:hypothetical protein